MESLFFVSHWSAIRHWNPPWAVRFIESCAGLPKRLAPGLLHITYRNPGARSKAAGVKAHSCVVPFPEGAVVRMGASCYASPELAFVQVAEDLSFHQLLVLGLAMCATPMESGQPAVTSVARLRAFAERSKRLRGRPAALRACRFLLDRTGSFMELWAALVLTLPPKWGGVGFTGAELNMRVELSDEEQRIVRRGCLYADVAWRSAGVCVEYAGFEAHASREAQSADGVRASVLETRGLRVVPLVNLQLRKLDTFVVFLRQLRGLLRGRGLIRTPRFFVQFRKLRSLMVRIYRKDATWNDLDEAELRGFYAAMHEVYRPYKIA